MKKVDSDALGLLNRSLGLTGAGSQITELADGIVDQVIDVRSAVRRGRTQANSQGIYTAIIRNVHSAANALSTAVNVFDLTGGTGVVAPYPNPIPAQFDLWLLAASIIQSAGATTITAGLNVNFTADQQGWGIDNGGSAVAGISSVIVAFWDTLVNVGNVTHALTGNGDALARIMMRLPRKLGTQLVFGSNSSAATTFQLDLILGLFPITLGQDGLV